ncbi:MAG: transporter associated domain-containing protein, partial [Rhizomicrobium sp.]
LAQANIIRKLLFVPPSMRAIDLLAQMQASRIHLALVVDEYGGTDGMVSIEDIIEEIVGDITDEHDEEAPHTQALPGGAFLADARIGLEDFKDETGIDIPLTEDEEEIETLGGLAVAILGRVPQRGEIVHHPAGYEFEILEADPRRVKRLRIRPLDGTAAAQTE